MRGQSKKKINKAGWLLFYLYIILLSYFLFVSERYGLKEYRWNFHLFKEINRFIQYREQIGLKSFVENILGNVLAFAPFGFLLPILGKRYRNFFYTVFLCFLFSLTAETIQLFLKIGIFDVDDIFMNTLGGFLGYIAYALMHVLAWAFKPSKKKSRRK